MFSETISPDTNRLIEKIKNRPWLSPYYLAGGTALAFHVLANEYYQRAFDRILESKDIYQIKVEKELKWVKPLQRQAS